MPVSESDLTQQVSNTWSCDGEEQFRYTVSELDGEGLVDLVITDGCDAEGVGAERWFLHTGTCD